MNAEGEDGNGAPHSCWTKFSDKKSGRVFYFNSATQTSSWTLPPDRWLKAELTQRKEKITRTYYYNPFTMQTTWAQPISYDESFEESKVPETRRVMVRSKKKKGKANYATCFDRINGRAYWYSENNGKRVWDKPVGVKHPYHQSETMAESRLRKKDAAMEVHIKIQEQYRDLAARLDQLSKREEHLRLDLGLKRQRLKNLEASRNEKIKLHMQRQSVNMVAEAMKNAYSIPVQSRVEMHEKQGAVVSFLKSIDLFLYLSEEQYNTVALNISLQEHPSSVVLGDIGAKPAHLMIIEDGTVGVFVNNKGNGHLNLDKLPMEVSEESFGEKVNMLYPGDYIGAAEILDSTTYNHKFVCLTSCKIYTLPVDSFSDIVKEGNRELLNLPTIGGMTEQVTHKAPVDLKDTSAIMHMSNLINNENEMMQTQSSSEVSSLTNFVTYFSSLNAIYIERHDQSKKRVGRALMNLSTAFAPFMNVEDILFRVVFCLRQIFGTNDCNIFKVEDVEDDEQEQGVRSLVEDSLIGRHKLSGLDDGIVAECINTNSILNVKNDQFQKFIKDKSVMMKVMKQNITGVLVCPICTENNDVIGAIRILHNNYSPNFTEQDQRVLAAIGEQVSSVFTSTLFNPVFSAKLLPVHAFPDVSFRVGIRKFVGSKIGIDHPSKEILVAAYLYNGDEMLCPPCFVQIKDKKGPEITIAVMNVHFNLEITYANLPRTATLVFQVYSVDLSTQETQLKKIFKDNEELRDVFNSSAAVANSNSEVRVRKLSIASIDEATNQIVPGGTSSSHASPERYMLARALCHLSPKLMMSMSHETRANLFDAITRTQTPHGWTACGLFDFDQALVNGRLPLRLLEVGLFNPRKLLNNPSLDSAIPEGSKNHGIIEVDLFRPRLKGDITDKDYAVIYTDNDYSESAQTFQSVTNFNTQSGLNLVGNSSGVFGTIRSKKTEHVDMGEEVKKLLYADPLHKLTEDEKMLIMKHKDYLVDENLALPRFVESISFKERNSVLEMYEYLHAWQHPDHLVAFQLLSPIFVDYKVRSLAVAALSKLSNEELARYMLQLVQCLRLERFLDNALICLLLTRSIRNPWLVGVTFYWAIKTEIEKLSMKRKYPKTLGRYRVYLQIYLRHCRNRMELGHQMFVTRKLIECHEFVVAHAKKNVKDRVHIMRKELTKIVFPDRFRLPTNNTLWCNGINVERCRVMSSKKLPFQLAFTVEDSPDEEVEVIFKFGDDLRQDQLTLQAFSVIDSIWKRQNIDMKLSIYRCVATSTQAGFIEVVKNSQTVAKIQVGEKKTTGFKFLSPVVGAYRALKHDRMKRLFHNRKEFIKTNFVPSCAGYCVLTYILGIGDRHNDNMMLTDDLKLFHIDFGHFLGNYKKKLGIARERANFVLSQQMYKLMLSENLFDEFKAKFIKAFNVLREPKNGNLLITLFALMASSDLTELKHEDDILWIRKKLRMDMDDTLAIQEMDGLIQQALATNTTHVNHFTHIVVHYNNY